MTKYCAHGHALVEGNYTLNTQGRPTCKQCARDREAIQRKRHSHYERDKSRRRKSTIFTDPALQKGRP